MLNSELIAFFFASLTDRTSDGSVWLVCLWSFTALNLRKLGLELDFVKLSGFFTQCCFDFCSIRSLSWFSFPFLIDRVDSVRSTTCQRKFWLNFLIGYFLCFDVFFMTLDCVWSSALFALLIERMNHHFCLIKSWFFNYSRCSVWIVDWIAYLSV